ncbi:zonadhesin-like [Phlebotomus argentipes]|uniref:zonadhesin-like n=1 Tax=Phlebotomus argentipes TaxID=94469 RepID=UPI0028933304|nr:zonadhesin-like [Phlebotomus argentipes]
MDSKPECFENCNLNPIECSQQPDVQKCFCNFGYVRIEGVCVPDTTCECDENSEYTHGNECFDTCGTNPENCSKLPCHKSCYCDDGFVRIDGNCVAETECACGENEEYKPSSECIEECGQDEDTCKDAPVWKRCSCIAQFKRVDGVCVPDTTCECPENEHMDSLNSCFETCGTNLHDCTQEPVVRKCYCDLGFVRVDGVCVADSACECPENSAYVHGNECYETCSSNPIECAKLPCQKSCHCNDGFVRIEGNCVAETECTCGDNEEYRPSSECIEECGQDEDTCKDAPVWKRCSCIAQFKRVDGVCVPDTTCECPENEHMDSLNSCYETCGTNLHDCTQEPVRKCYCDLGFVRVDGVCVADSACECPENSAYVHGNECYETCGSNPIECAKLPCQKSCHCNDGFVRIDGNCVAETECTCGDNEEYRPSSECIEECGQDEDTCKDAPVWKRCSCIAQFKRVDGVCVPDTTCECPENEHMDSLNSCYEICGTNLHDCTQEPVVRKCYCDLGFVRVDGVCVADSACECPENSAYVHGNECYETCSSNPIECAKMPCQKSCHCNDGFVRIDGNCVAETECTCGDNEEYRPSSECIEECGQDEDTCKDAPVWKRCSCIAQFKRVDGVCVPDTTCECPENEHMDSLNSCYETCGTNLHDCTQEPVVRKCYCDLGFVRVDGVCVADSACECPENSAYVHGNECYETCGSNPIECAKLPCQKSCHCNDGFVRIDGNCVAETECTCGDNEEYRPSSECIEECGQDEDTCKDAPVWKRCSCIAQFKRVDGVCVPDTTCECPENEHMDSLNSCYETCGTNLHDCTQEPVIRKCYCDLGFVRVDGVCVADSACECPENSAYVHGNECYETCGSNPIECAKMPCQKSCHCNDGFVRIDGNCVAETECTCGDNEEYRPSSECIEECGQDEDTCKDAPVWKRCSCIAQFKRVDGVCVPDTTCECPENEHMDSLNSCYETCGTNLHDCTQEPVVRKCYCDLGFVRVDGVCVADSACECPENSEYVHGNECYETCGSDPIECGKLPCQKSCHCSEGFVRIDGNCVADSECECPDTEEYVYGNDCIENCFLSLSDCRQFESHKRCTCLDGFKRISGVCVPDTECECGTNEVFRYGSACADICGNTIDSCLGSECYKGCFCAEGFKRIDGACMPADECACGDNEEEKCDWDCRYDSISLLNCNFSLSDQLRDFVKCALLSPSFADSAKLKGETCGRNEVYTDCGRDCQTTCDNMGVKCPITHIICPAGCYCQPGYARIYEDGCCVEQDICPSSPCGDNEQWLECGDPPQPIPCPQNCLDVGKECTEELPTCDAPVPGGCYCKPGFARAPDSERCVPIESCSAKN